MSDSGPFRPLRPFTEGDRALFFGRDRELAELGEKLGGDRPLALLFGEAGIGKTSLVRAGVLPAAKSRGLATGYLDAGALEVRQVPSSAGVLAIDDLGAALDEGPHLERLVAVLQQAHAVRGLKVLLVIDDVDLWKLDTLERMIGPVAPSGTRLRLERFDEARTGDVIERSVLGGGAYFEAGLSHEIAIDLAKNGPVSPSELQLVAGAAVSLRLNSLKAYRRSGGADVITWRFFDEACRAAGGRPAARALAEIAALGPRGVASRDAVERAAAVDERAAESLSQALAKENLVRAAGGGWTLANEWVRPLARAYTGEVRGRGVAARLLLRRKIENGGLLALGAVREVRRYAGTLSPDEEGVVKKSLRVGALVTAVLLALPIVALSLLYVSRSHSLYLDADASPGAEVVARLGQPGSALTILPHRPAFGAIVADSGFARAALKDGLPSGSDGRDGDGWMRRLIAALRPLPGGAAALILDGNLKPLAEAYGDQALRPSVVEAVGTAGRGSPEELELLKRALADPSEDVRRAAIEAAAAIQKRAPGGAAELLAAGLKDASPSVRGRALREIERLPDEQSAPLLAQALGSATDPVVRRNALEAIGAQVARTPPAAAALGKAMLGPARVEATAILARLVDGNGPSADAAADALAKVALNAAAPEEARLDALRLLRKRPDSPAGIGALTGSPKLLAMAMPLVVRANPAEAQAKVADAMHGPAPLRAAAAAALGLLPRTPDTPKQLHVLSLDSAVEVHAESVRALPVLGREALPLLIKEAKTGGAEVERAAVETLGAQAAKLGAQSAAQALEATVKGARPSTRKAAIEALGRIAEQKPAIAAAALGRLVRDKNPEVRADAAGALGDVISHGGKEAIAALRAVSKDPDAATRRRAAGALGRASASIQSTAARALTPFAADADPGVRLEAATALGQLGTGAQEGGALAALVADKDASVRAAARKAAQQASSARAGGSPELDKALLGSFAAATTPDKIEIAATAGMVGAPSTVRAALADPEPAVRRAAAEHAGGLGAANVAALVGALGDADAAVRVAAVRGLVGSKASAELAQAARSPDLDVRVAALEALGEVGGAAARAALESALDDASERVRVAAVRGLQPLGKEVADRLERALHDPSRDVRDAAVIA
ncbi:MAG TPA: HEAT repeat domain-containing protein, partial [Polyangia bacterium]|nr:HEAT repeat domain-containing protein [Polyangia bacterium]